MTGTEIWVYPPYHFKTHRLIGAISGPLYELSFDTYYNTPIHYRIRTAGIILQNIIDDDRLGLIGATPEHRVRFYGWDAKRMGLKRPATHFRSKRRAEA